MPVSVLDPLPAELLGQISDQQNQIDALQKKIDAHIGERKQLQNCVCQQQLSVADSKQKINKQHVEIVELHGTVNQHCQQLEEKDKEIGKLKHACFLLNEIIVKKQDEIGDFEIKIHDLLNKGKGKGLQQVDIGEHRGRIDQQKQQLAKKDQKIDNLKHECSRLCKDLKTAKDDRFEKSKKNFREEFDNTLNQRDMSALIADVLNNRFADSVELNANVLQLRAIFDRITTVHKLKRPYEDLLDSTVKLFFPDRLFEKKDKTPPVLIVDLDSVLSVIGTDYFFKSTRIFTPTFSTPSYPVLKHLCSNQQRTTRFS